jgi:hypothetical protein
MLWSVFDVLARDGQPEKTVPVEAAETLVPCCAHFLLDTSEGQQFGANEEGEHERTSHCRQSTRLALKAIVTTSKPDKCWIPPREGAEADELAAKLRFVRPAETSFDMLLVLPVSASNTETGSTTCCIVLLIDCWLTSAELIKNRKRLRLNVQPRS